MLSLRIAALATLLSAGLLTTAHADKNEYRLGPQDVLQVKVYDLRTGTGEAYQWTAFNGDFIVSASGRVSLPLVGQLDADNKTTADLAKDLATGLQAKVGLAVRPDASIQVIKYRPFYVVGEVEKPGEYEYRPDLTVLQAVGVAGGLQRVTGDALLGYQRESLNVRGDLRSLAVERIGLVARQARLDAEIGEADSITLPDKLTGRSDPDLERTLREEQMLFASRRNGLNSQVSALNDTKVVLNQEVESLGEKDVSLSRQLDVTKKELAQITGLVSKGLTVLPRQLEMEQTTAQFETNRLDVGLAILRAKQDVSKADRDIIDLKNTRRNEALQEATEVHNRLTQVDEKIETAARLADYVEVLAPGVVEAKADERASPNFLITRRIDGAVTTIAAKEGDDVLPGDVVRVLLKTKLAGSEAGLSGKKADANDNPF